MRTLIILASLVTLAVAQYDYTPPQRQFDAKNEQKDKPTYGPPNHTPGVPQGSEDLQGPAPQPQPVRRPPQPQQLRPRPQPQSERQFSPRPVAPQPQPQQSFRQQGGYQQRQPQPQSQSFQGNFQPQPQSFQPQPHSQGGYQQQPQQGPAAEDYTPKLYKHVYVHTAPDEEPDVQSRVIRVPGGDKHVNIIFVKTPSQDSQQQTEVILPEQDEHKNLVYVLLKKGENNADIKIRKPAAKQPKKPEVYFIRYNDNNKEEEQQQQQGGYQQQPQQPQGDYQQRRQPSQQQFQRQPQQQQQQSFSNANAGGYEGAVAPAPITSPSQIPSSGYGVPL